MVAHATVYSKAVCSTAPLFANYNKRLKNIGHCDSRGSQDM